MKKVKAAPYGRQTLSQRQSAASALTAMMNEDPIKSHDGMDMDPHSAVVETSGYGYKLEVAEDVVEAFREDLDDERDALASRL